MARDLVLGTATIESQFVLMWRWGVGVLKVTDLSLSY